MFFKKRADRIRKIEQTEEEFKNTLKEEPLEKSDKLAMLLASLIVFLPALIVVILFFALMSWWFF